MSDTSEFEKMFLNGSNAERTFTESQVDQILAESRAEIMAMAVAAAQQAVLIEREACAVLADNCLNIETLGDEIRNRLNKEQ